METYYDPADLARFGEIGKDAPELASKFFDYYGAVFAEGALTEREKSLIALAVAHADNQVASRFLASHSSTPGSHPGSLVPPGS